MKRLADFRKQVFEGWTVQRIAFVLIVVGLAVFVVGAVSQYCVCAGWPNLGDVLNHIDRQDIADEERRRATASRCASTASAAPERPQG